MSDDLTKNKSDFNEDQTRLLRQEERDALFQKIKFLEGQLSVSRKQLRDLSKASHNLSDANQRLTSANRDMAEANKSLSNANEQLIEANEDFIKNSFRDNLEK